MTRVTAIGLDMLSLDSTCILASDFGDRQQKKKKKKKKIY